MLVGGGVSVVVAILFWAVVALSSSVTAIWVAFGAVIVVPILVGISLARHQNGGLRLTVVYLATNVIVAVAMVILIGTVLAFTMETLGPSN